MIIAARFVMIPAFDALSRLGWKARKKQAADSLRKNRESARRMNLPQVPVSVHGLQDALLCVAIEELELDRLARLPAGRKARGQMRAGLARMDQSGGRIGGLVVLGYRGNPTWRDMSEYIVHFCRTREALMAILTSGAIEDAHHLGWAREFEQERDAAKQRGERLIDYPTQKSVCLSEVPLDLLDRLVARRGPWGLGFTKKSVVADGGAPVWYVEKDTALASALEGLQQSLTTPNQHRDWHRISPFIDKVGEFPDGTIYRFEWEREWRVPRRLDLDPGLPAFLFAPTAEHAQLVADLTTRGVDGKPPRIAPLLDPMWDEAALQATLAQHGL